MKDLETHLQRLKSDLHNCVGFIQEPRKLKDSVQMIYARYVPQGDGVSGSRSVVNAEQSITVRVQGFIPLRLILTSNLLTYSPPENCN